MTIPHYNLPRLHKLLAERGVLDEACIEKGYLAVLKSRDQLRVAVLKLMADERLDAIIYMTYDAPPTVIAPDVLTNPRPNDNYSRGDNRGLSPLIGFPALTVPAGFTAFEMT